MVINLKYSFKLFTKRRRRQCWKLRYMSLIYTGPKRDPLRHARLQTLHLIEYHELWQLMLRQSNKILAYGAQPMDPHFIDLVNQPLMTDFIKGLGNVSVQCIDLTLSKAWDRILLKDMIFNSVEPPVVKPKRLSISWFWTEVERSQTQM